MAVNLSPVGGVAGQFFDNNGVPLSGGKIYTYTAGTTTNQATYTNASGAIAHTNPIVLDSGGRVPSGEIWLTDGLQYKFVLKTSADVLIGTYDNIIGINSNFVNFVTEEEIQTATAGQTVFTLGTMQYQPGTNNLTVYVDGVNQYDGASYSYVETSSTVVTFTAGLHVGALVKFTTAQTLSTGVTDSSLVAYQPAGSGAVATTVQTKLRETVSVKDFGAVGDGVTDDTSAIQAGIDATKDGAILFFPTGVYYCTSTLIIGRGSKLQGENLAVPDPRSLSQDVTKIKFAGGISGVEVDQADLEDGYVWGIAIENLYFESVIGDNGPIGINLQKVAQSRFKNIGCERFTVGLKITLGMYNTFDSCSLQRCGTTSLLLADTDGVTTTQRFVDCVFRESDWAARLTTSGSYMLDTVFDHCAFESTNIGGVSVHKGCSVTFIEPYFENVSAAASSLSGTAIRLYVDGSSSRADTLSVCNIFGGDISGPNTGSGFANALVYVGDGAATVNIVGGLYQRGLYGVQVDASCKDFVVNADNPSFVSVTNIYSGTDAQRIGTWPTGVLASTATRKRSYWKYLASPLGIGQTSPETNVSSNAILGFGASGKWLLSQDATVAQNEYVDLGLNTGGGSFTGLLLVTNVATANTAFRTHTVFLCAGRGTDAVATSIATDDGPGAASFIVTFPSTGVARITNTYAGNTRLDVVFFGNQGA